MVKGEIVLGLFTDSNGFKSTFTQFVSGVPNGFGKSYYPDGHKGNID